MADLNVNSIANAAGNQPCTGITPAENDNSNKIATTAFAQTIFKPAFGVEYGSSSGTATGSRTVIWDNKIFDTNNAFSLSNNQFTIPANAEGLYQFYCSLRIADNSGGNNDITVSLFKNGVSVGRLFSGKIAGSTSIAIVQWSGLLLSVAAAGDIFKIDFSSSAASSYGGSSFACKFFGYKLGVV